ncbi:unnamed protein product [Phytophthora fragariaefolia]|uniref:Unnamed protein product n=1 Tax=Phytophthora fragariaefolia TaxID=1490495 RepID=A0A9W6XTN1_9STRA|nr:unnamed protein product [Phytophthora fragariaefolia]
MAERSRSSRITDHAALKWLMTRPNLAVRLRQWSITLQEYEFEIVYQPGTTNVVADALSRDPAAGVAAVGKTRGWRLGAHAAENEEDETKSEEDELPTTEDVWLAEEYAQRMAGQPQTVALPGAWTATAPGTTSVTATAMGPTGEKASMSTRPWTRADKRRAEAEAAARIGDTTQAAHGTTTTRPATRTVMEDKGRPLRVASSPGKPQQAEWRPTEPGSDHGGAA